MSSLLKNQRFLSKVACDFSLEKSQGSRILPIPREIIKNYGEFSVSFNTTFRLPNYTKYYLYTSGNRCKKNYFVSDPDLNTLYHKSYTNIVYDSGPSILFF
jgi:DNA/RNA endonuclease G (NUC1)